MPPDEERLIRRWIEYWEGSNQHRTGTPEDSETTKWLAQELSNLGATPTVKDFPFQRLEPMEANLIVGDSVVQGIPVFDGGATPASGISGHLSQSEENGAIVVFDASQPQSRLTTLRRNPGIQGIVYISALSGPDIALLNSDLYENPFGPPVLQVASEYGNSLTDAANRSQRARLTVRFRREDTHATNVQTKFTGSNASLDPLVVMTPKSAWYTCTAERIGGIVAWLECARLFASHPPSRDVVLTANTGHELGHVGLIRFLNEYDRLMCNASLWVHFGANFAAKGSRIRLQASDSAYLSRLSEQLEKRAIGIADIVQPGTRPGGEARNIFDGGGNYVSILGSNRLFHHPEDTFASNVDFERMAQIKDALVESVKLWASDV